MHTTSLHLISVRCCDGWPLTCIVKSDRRCRTYSSAQFTIVLIVAHKLESGRPVVGVVPLSVLSAGRVENAAYIGCSLQKEFTKLVVGPMGFSG